MPVKRISSGVYPSTPASMFKRPGWRVKSAVTGKWLKKTYPTKAKAEQRYQTSKRRAARKRSR